MTRALDMMSAEELAGRLERVESAAATAGLLASSAGFDNGELLLLSATDNPQRVKKSTANECESVLIENPSNLPLLINLDGDATPNLSPYRVPPFRGRMIAQPHRIVSVGVDPALLSEEPTSQVIVYVAQYLKGYAPGTFPLVNTPAPVVVPNTISGLLNTVVAGPNVAAATVLLQAKATNGAPVFVGTSAQTTGNLGTDVGVVAELTAGTMLSLEVANLNLLTFGSTAAFVVYATAFR